MANPSSQRLNSPALLKDFQLVTCKGLEEKGRSQNICWLEAMIYFCLISNGKLFTCSAFQPHEIRSCVHRCCGHRHRPRCLRGRGALRRDPTKLPSSLYDCQEAGELLLRILCPKRNTQTKGCFPMLFCYCKLFSWKRTTRMGKGSPSWAGKQVCLSPQHLCRIVTSYPTQLHPRHLPSSSFHG